MTELKMMNIASKLNAAYSVHTHTLAVSILELQGSTLLSHGYLK